MDPQSLELQTRPSAQNTESSAEIFTIVQHWSSQIDKSRMSQAIDAIRNLMTEEKQVIVDFLGIALEKHHLFMDADRSITNLLIQIVSSANVVASNRTLCSKYLTPDIGETSPGVYIVQGEPPPRVRVVKQSEKGTSEASRNAMIVWAHLSHINILPVYGVLLNGEHCPISFVSPWLDERNLVDHAKTLIQVERIPLILDVIDGLCYLHQLDIVHGALEPQSVLISDNGRALITDLDAPSETSTIRYSAPELLENEDDPPTKAADVWAFGCLCYEPGAFRKCPILPIPSRRQVSLAVVKGKGPTRPGQEGVKGEEISDVEWRPVSGCWEFEPEDRPSCVQLHGAFASMDIRDDRPVPNLMFPSTALGDMEGRIVDFENTKPLFNRVFGSDQLSPHPSQIPKHFRQLLTGLFDDFAKAPTVAVAVKKLNRDDTQTLADVLDLILEEDSSPIKVNNPVVKLLGELMMSTQIYPQRYKLHRIRYDPSPIAENNYGKVYKGLDLDVCINAVTDLSNMTRISKYASVWAHSSHPNILPFYGVFDEVVNEIPRFCVVSQYMKNGTLQDYAPHCPQNSRVQLISDVIEGLDYIHSLDMLLGSLKPNIILISDDGRALVNAFNTTVGKTSTGITAINSSTYNLRFRSPEGMAGKVNSRRANIWSFGCICYEVLSRKLPYHQYLKKEDIQSALSQGEAPNRPCAADSDADEIEDQFWDLITGCCRLKPEDRLTASEIKKLLTSLKIQDDRSDALTLSWNAIMSLRKHPNIEWDRVKRLLSQIQIELLRKPLSKLVQNHTKDVAAEVVKLRRNDVRTLVDSLDMILKDHLTIAEERNRVLALLSKIMTSAQVFPRRYELKGIKYNPTPIAEGGFGKVHRGRADPTICVKVMTRVNDPHALVAYIKELVSWAHSSHPNILPFYGVFFNDSQQICLVSPYMTKGNLRDYGYQLPQKSRVPMLLDTIKGLDYLHGLGVVHTDLKGENVLISDEGRALITDFGASHIVTATAKGGATDASVASTLRFTAVEMIRDQTRQLRPTKECDIWSFGCLCYEILSRKLPYYEYQIDAQVFAAVFRGQLPKRPGPPEDVNDDDEWDDLDEKDWDDLDDISWNLIMECLAPNPEDRPSTSRIQELIIDMKAWDSRRPAKGMPGAAILEQKCNVEIDLRRARSLLDRLQVLFLARNIYSYSNQDVVAAIEKLSQDEADNLSSFWASALENHFSLVAEGGRLLEIHSTSVASRQSFPTGYVLQNRPQLRPNFVGRGSFGKVYRGAKLNVCIKVYYRSSISMNPGFEAQWDRVVIPWAHMSHPNILPFYGLYIGGGDFLVFPFIGNGDLHSYAPSLSHKSRMLLVSDIVEGLMYLHGFGVIHGNLKTQNVLISDEGRALITDFRPYHVNVAAAADGPTGPFIISTLRFTAPELVKNSQMLPTTGSDVWSVGCLVYEVLSQKVPYYTYTQKPEIRAALSRGELLIRPILAGTGMDEIDDESWDLIMMCCALEAEGRLTLAGIQDWVRKMGLEDNRLEAKPLPGAEILEQRNQYTDIDTIPIENILDKLEAYLAKVTQEGVKDDEH